MLDLQPGIDFEEVEAALLTRRSGTIAVRRAIRRRRRLHQKLDRSGTDVAGRPRQPHGCRPERLPGRSGETGCRAFLDQLLEAPLQAAIALAQMTHVAVRIGENLHLDVPGPLHLPFGVHPTVAKRRRRFATRALQRRR